MSVSTVQFGIIGVWWTCPAILSEATEIILAPLRMETALFISRQSHKIKINQLNRRKPSKLDKEGEGSVFFGKWNGRQAAFEHLPLKVKLPASMMVKDESERSIQESFDLLWCISACLGASSRRVSSCLITFILVVFCFKSALPAERSKGCAASL